MKGMLIFLVGTAIVVACSIASVRAVKELHREHKEQELMQRNSDLCASTVKLISNEGWVESYHMSPDGKMAVEVGDPFYADSFENKRGWDWKLRCSAEKSTHITEARYLDYRTHKEVARWTNRTGFIVF